MEAVMPQVRVDRLLPVVVGVLALLFAVLDPPASRGLAFGPALLFWLLHIGMGMVLAVWATAALGNLRPLAGWAPWFRITAGGVLGSLLFAPVALGLDVFWPVSTAKDLPDDLLDEWEAAGGPLALLAEWLSLLPSYLAAWLLVNVLPLTRGGEPTPALPGAAGASGAPLLAGTGGGAGQTVEVVESAGAICPAPTDPPPIRAEPSGSAESPESSEPPATFLDLLPPAIGTELISIQSDLHYLQVRTTRGRATILANMASAEAALAGTGLRVHRSYWVALAHVVRLVRSTRGTFVILSDGERVPVSRRRASEVQSRLGRDFVVDGG
jgi:hypothetical protein